ncbi:unnamed protein product [Candida verbasci]|uniref:Aminopeptidase P N-terminal domain-containing protein n=1 Tax=Candida verbasci TaxID=1227364 RepID=A0A9W4TV12_9ASCO|nr:unnamed protein product [Candida verbasci]
MKQFKVSIQFKRFIQINSRPTRLFTAGQPIHETRPHLIPTPGNLTPGISALEYYQRRLKLCSNLPKKSLCILFGNIIQYSSGSVFYDFQQDNDLYYLTGWLEPDSIIIIEKKFDNGNDEDVNLHMLVPPKNPQLELWQGVKSGLEGAYEFFNADYVEDINKATIYLKNLISSNDYIYWDKKFQSQDTSPIKSFFNFSHNQNLNEIILKCGKPIKSLSKLTTEMRAIKSNNEIKVMHAANQISSRAINKAIGKVGSRNPIMSEKTLAKFLDYQFVKGGCDKQAYIPVVASGSNALTIHYTRNDDLLFKDELVFIDAGGKLGGYCADISRAWPNNPKGFNDPQRDLYEVVLNTNKQCIELCDESLGYTLNDIHEFSVNSLFNNLKNLPAFKNVTKNEVSKILYPHYIGHHLGLDLHDIPLHSRFNKLVEGNVITIEPGLYIPKDDRWSKYYQGIGIRIEDDIVVGKTNDEIINLTSGCVKEVQDIESLIRNGVTTPGIHDELVELDI